MGALPATTAKSQLSTSASPPAAVTPLTRATTGNGKSRDVPNTLWMSATNWGKRHRVALQSNVTLEIASGAERSTGARKQHATQIAPTDYVIDGRVEFPQHLPIDGVQAIPTGQRDHHGDPGGVRPRPSGPRRNSSTSTDGSDEGSFISTFTIMPARHDGSSVRCRGDSATSPFPRPHELKMASLKAAARPVLAECRCPDEPGTANSSSDSRINNVGTAKEM